MANDLVKFPEAGDLWEEVDGPGMYVLAVLLREPVADPCAIGAAITLLRPRGRMLSAVRPLWSTDESRDGEVGLIEESARLFEECGEPAKAATLRAQVPLSDLSDELVLAVRMGATARTLRSTKTGEFWTADWTDLTPSGVLLLHQVHTCFVRPPLMITFMGDESA